MSTSKATLINHNGQRRIAVQFENKAELRYRFKQLRGARWSSSKKVWHLPDTKVYRKQFGLPLYDKGILSEEKVEQLKKFEDWLKAHKYAKSTVNTYGYTMRVFFMFYNEKPLSEINNDDIIRFNNEYIIKKDRSNSDRKSTRL